MLESQEDVLQAAALASWLDRPSVSDVVVALPWLDTAERASSARAIRRLFNDCGCGVGSVAFVATVTAVVLPRVLSRAWSWPSLGTAVGAGIAAAVAGKLAGLAWSRWRLRTRLRRLAETRPAESAVPAAPAESAVPAAPVKPWGGLGEATGP
ncbi:hypothetical protein HC031_02560 [Planosporangium thailandense]|uniref:Transmembrane protein n=1 Tax=Planosporangium thailandense TaxID=765197 RepID=A0ABX0XRH6_9ACTN|nr:hypothetical protein [Planosporangium thailandense]NJC68611.1 hypothetical protein [Planosporangium thailandense]